MKPKPGTGVAGRWGDAKPIETIYRGYRFRSRLEARWAVFFDALGIVFEYEPEGFDLNGLWYLPDFWLPTQGCWVEIKPTDPSAEEKDKARRLAVATGRYVYLFPQAPEQPHMVFERPQEDTPTFFGFGLYFAPDGDHDGMMAWGECPGCQSYSISLMGGGWSRLGPVCKCGIDPTDQSSRLRNAYAAARQARFEGR